MTYTDSWKKTAAIYDIPADILFIVEHTLDTLKTPFTQQDNAEAAAWLLIHLMQMEKAGSILCDLALLPFSLRLWLSAKEHSTEKLIQHILAHYPNVLENPHFSSRDPGENVPIVQVGERFLYLRKNYLLEDQFWQLFRKQILPYMPYDYLGLALRDEEIKEENPALASALRIIHNSNFLLLTGGPGSGKTFTLAIILKSLIEKARIVRPQQPLKIILSAPTGRAQARMIESLHAHKDLLHLEEIPQEGQTLHALLHHRPHALEERPPQLLYADIVAVDEASMIDLQLFSRLLQALPQKTKLILIGDPDQLPSVEMGTVFADMLRMRAVKTHLLQDHIVELSGSRRSSNEDINFLARAAKEGQSHDFQRFLLPQLPASSAPGVHVIDIEHFSSGQIIAWLKKQYAHITSLLSYSFTHRPDEMMPEEEQKHLEKIFEAFGALCILCARKDRHPLSAEALNYALAPSHAQGMFCHGMPVIVTKNMEEYQLTNGERGVLLEIHQQLLCCFRHSTNNAKFRAIPVNILLECTQPSYAMTIHKSQGSEFDHVFILLPDHCEMLLSRSLLFTAITRARHSLTILTDMKTLDLSLEEGSAHISALAYLFAGEDPAAQKMPPSSPPSKDEKTGQLSLF